MARKEGNYGFRKNQESSIFGADGKESLLRFA